MKSVFAVIDCNNFFVSCEKLFRPDLVGKPVIVLSSNDGCAISRSNEVKALGIPMGIPEFQIRDQVKRHGITLFSSNFTLYRDMSRRVMQLLERFSSDVNIYSIDEAFILLQGTNKTIRQQCLKIKHDIETEVGIPVSVGYGPSKTLAKRGVEEAKSCAKYQGVYGHVTQKDYRTLLKETSLGKIWNIGSQTRQKLQEAGISDALIFCDIDSTYVRARLGITGARIQAELQGEPTDSNERVVTKKAIMSSRSFGKDASSFEVLRQALLYHVTYAAQKMRSQGSACHHMSVSISTLRHRKVRHHRASRQLSFEMPVLDTMTLATQATKTLKMMQLPGIKYGKVAVSLSGFVPAETVPKETLFSSVDDREELMQALDGLNKKYGNNTIKLAAAGCRGNTSHYKGEAWHPKATHMSHAFTTDWQQLATVRA